jgi:hypothetical protein
MTTSTSGAFRYAGIAALPICLALAFVAAETTHRNSTATGQGPQTNAQCVVGAHRACADEPPTTLGEVPFLGELTVTERRGEAAPPAVRSASDRSRPPRPQTKPSRAKYSSVL